MLEIWTCLFLVEPALESLQNFVPVETLVPVAALQHLEHSLVLVVAEAEKEQPLFYKYEVCSVQLQGTTSY